MQHLVFRAAEQGAGPGIEDGVRRRSGGRCALLSDLVLQVLDEQLVGALVQHCKAVARDEHCRAAHTPLWILSNRQTSVLDSMICSPHYKTSVWHLIPDMMSSSTCQELHGHDIEQAKAKEWFETIFLL